jgi:hypothetical protein
MDTVEGVEVVSGIEIRCRRVLSGLKFGGALFEHWCAFLVLVRVRELTTKSTKNTKTIFEEGGEGTKTPEEVLEYRWRKALDSCIRRNDGLKRSVGVSILARRLRTDGRAVWRLPARCPHWQR